MNNYIKSWSGVVFVGILMVSFVIGLITVLKEQHKEDMVKQKQYYQECKERTGDPEWCMQSILDVEL